MESLIGLVNRIQRACTMLGDYGGGDNAFSSLWEALPSVAVVGGQVLLLFLNFLLIFVSSFVTSVATVGNSCRRSMNYCRGGVSALVFQSGVRLLKNSFMARVLGRWNDFFTKQNESLLFDFSLFVYFSHEQSSGKSSVLESIVGRDFLPRGSGEAFDLGSLRIA